MSLSVAALKKMQELGLTLDQVVELAEVIEATSVDTVDAVAVRKRAADRDRMREKRHVARQSRDLSSDTLSPSLSPQTPQTHPHTRECITTPARKAVDFERFWTAYPRKVGKGDARKAFDKACRKIGEGAEEVLSGALERAKAAWTDAQFIPHPATWLNRESWEDEPQQIAPRKAHEPNHRQSFNSRDDRLRAMHAGTLAALDDALNGL